MQFEEAYFRKKEVDRDSLLAFGFVKEGEDYRYVTSLIDGELDAILSVDTLGYLTGQVVDVDFGEDYDAFRSPRAEGPYVGKVRDRYGKLLARVAENCYRDKFFQSPQSNRLVDHLQKTFQDSSDHPFDKYPDYLSFRVAGKWYALFFSVTADKFGISGKKAKQTLEVVNIKVAPSQIPQLLMRTGIFPSYHMSKKTWVSIVLDDSLSDQDLFTLVEESRKLATPAHMRQGSQPHYWIIPANLKYYSIDQEFEASPQILWTQKAKIAAGDCVAIYITAPTKAIRYLCRVLEANIPNQGYRQDETIKTLMRLEKLQEFSGDVFSLDVLKTYGIKTIRGPRHMTSGLIEQFRPILDATQDQTD